MECILYIDLFLCYYLLGLLSIPLWRHRLDGVTQKAFLVYNLLAKGWVPHHLGAKTSPCRCRCQGPYKDHKPLALRETGQQHPLPTSQGHTGHSQTFQQKIFTIRNAPFVMDNKDREALRELHAKCAGMCLLALNFKVVFLGEIWPPFCLWGRKGRRMKFHFIGTKWNDSRGAAGQGPGRRPSLGLYFCSRSGPGHREEGQTGVSPDRRYQEPPPQRDSAVFNLEAATAMILRFWEHWLPLLASQNEETFGIFLDVFPKYVVKIEKQVQGHSVWQTNQVYCKKSCLVFVSSSWWMRSFGL